MRNYLFVKDTKRRNNFWNKELLRLRYRVILVLDESLLKKVFKYFIYIKYLKTFYGDVSLTRIKNRCYLTDRGNAVFRFFRLSRTFLRNFLLNGKFMGFKKASW